MFHNPSPSRRSSPGKAAMDLQKPAHWRYPTDSTPSTSTDASLRPWKDLGVFTDNSDSSTRPNFKLQGDETPVRSSPDNGFAYVTASTGIELACQMEVTSQRGREFLQKILSDAVGIDQLECATLGLVETSGSTDKAEIDFRQSLYDSIWHFPTSPSLQIHRVNDAANLQRLSTPRDIDAFTVRFTGRSIPDSHSTPTAPSATDEDCAMSNSVDGVAVVVSDTDSLRTPGHQRKQAFPVVLGCLWGSIKDVILDSNGKKCLSGSLTESSQELPSADKLFGVRLGSDSGIDFCPLVEPGRQVIDCSKRTSPVFFVRSFDLLWGSVHRAVLGNSGKTETQAMIKLPSSLKRTSCVESVSRVTAYSPTFQQGPNTRWHVVSICGFPFLILTSIPGVAIATGDELVADRGPQWQLQRQRLDWPSIWNEFLRCRGVNIVETTPIAIPSASCLCQICFQLVDSDVRACDGCNLRYHQQCIVSFGDERKVSQSIEWFCSNCQLLAARVNKHGLYTLPEGALAVSTGPPMKEVSSYCVSLRGDESPLSHLKACQQCVGGSEGETSNLNVSCRLFRRHMSEDADSLAEIDPTRLALATASHIISSVTSALLKSERRNQLLQLRLSQSELNNPSQESHIALQFWRKTKMRFDMYRQRMNEISPEVPIIATPELSVFSNPSLEEDETVLHTISENDYDKDDEYFSDGSQTPHRQSRPGRSASDCRPQSIARCLLRDEFDPDRAAACIDNPVSFNEANIKAKRLRPWPRGISWNCKRLTWSVRFWKEDGRTLVATSVPARKHGGVEEAFRKAVALRRKSYMHVLARVAAECQAERRELAALRWSRSNKQWRAERNEEVRTWPAETEEEVRSTWRAAVGWLVEKGDALAAAIDMDAAERLMANRVRNSFPRPQDLSIVHRDGPQGPDVYATSECSRYEVYSGRSSRRRTSLGEFAETRSVEGRSDEGDVDDCLRRHPPAPTATSAAIQSLQPLPPGLIWARTTSRFFAVFRDPTGSAANRKKRFKTFDPKKFGGVNEAFEAASEFLQTVDPWITKSHAQAIANGHMHQRRSGASGKPYELDPAFEPDPLAALSSHETVLCPEETSSTGEATNDTDVQMDVGRKADYIQEEQFKEDDGMEDVPNNESTLAEPSSGSPQIPEQATLYSTDIQTQIVQMEVEVAKLPQCDRIKWYRSKRGFSASVNGQTKWFSAFSRGVTNAWHLASKWIDAQSSEGDANTWGDSPNLDVSVKLENINGRNEDGTHSGQASPVLRSRQRTSTKDSKENGVDRSPSGFGTPLWKRDEAEQEDPASPQRPRMDSIASLKSDSGVTVSAGMARLIEVATQAEEEGTWESDDSSSDPNEQAKRLPKISNICWVPQKQAFSVFYTKDAHSTSKTTKAFNPHYFGGVKRSFRQALLFALQVHNRHQSA